MSLNYMALIWKWGNGFGNAHIDSVLGKMIIDKWSLVQPQPSQVEVDQCMIDYESYMQGQDTKYIQYLSKISDLDYDQIDNYVDGITNLSGAKVLMKKMAFAIVALVNILKEERSVK